MNDNPYDPGAVYEAEPRTRSRGWLFKSSVTAFVLAIVSIIITQVCVKWSLFEPGDFEDRMRIAVYPAKAAVGLCLLGFVLLMAGIVFRRRGEETKD